MKTYYCAFTRTDAQLAQMSLQQIFRLDPKSARASDACDSLRIWNRLGWRPSSNMRGCLGFAPKLPGVYSSIGRIRKKQLKDPKGQTAYAGDCLAFRLVAKRMNSSRELLNSNQARTRSGHSTICAGSRTDRRW